MDRQLREMAETAHMLFPHLREGESVLAAKIQTLCLRAYEATDHVFAAKEAQEWADGYVVPPEYVQEDERDLVRCGFDLEALIQERFDRISDDRLSLQRVQTVLSRSNPEYGKVMELATTGITVHVDPSFVPNTSPDAPGRRPTFSKGYLSAPNAVNRSVTQLFREPGLAILVRSELVPLIRCPNAPGGTHLSKFSWAPKHGKKSGRPTSDASSAGTGNVPLNTPHVKDACDLQWGPIQHPTIKEWANAALEFLQEEQLRHPDHILGDDDVVQWKMDLDCAFSLLNFRVRDIVRMANEMTDGLTIFHLCGQFGWTGTPAAFQVITRALAWELAHSAVYKVTGRCLLYVDDIWGICLRRDLQHNLDSCRRLIQHLLGKNAVAEHKTVFGTRLPVIGYEIDLITRQVCIMDKNVLRAVYSYLSVDLSRPVPVRYMMKLASYASRYGAICTEMRPLARALYTSFSGLSPNTAVTVERMPDAARRSIQVLRLLIILASVDELHFTRSLESFATKAPTCTIEFDGCLHGAGILLFDVDPQGMESLFGGAAVDFTALGFNDDSSNQNLSEFLAGPVLGVRALFKMGRTPCTVRLRGDSITAITWAHKGSFRSDRVLNAATFFVLQCQLLGVTIVESVHLPKEQNTAADFLSRNRDSVPLLADFLAGDAATSGVTEMYRGLTQVDVEESQVLALCDPRLVASSDRDFQGLWARARRAILD